MLCDKKYLIGIIGYNDRGYLIITERKFIMENNKNTTNNKVDVDTKGGDGADTNTDTTDTKDTAQDTVTMSKVDYDKAIQSAEDKVIEKMSKEIRDLQAKIKELSPVEKTQAEIDVENRLAALEASEKAVAERERKIAIQEKLSDSGLNKALADYIKDDADIDKLSALVDGIVKSRMKANGYVPSDHSSDDKVTPEEFKKWSYSKKEKFAQEHPESYKRLMGKK